MKKAIKHILFGSSGFDINPYMDLINLHSNDASKFTLFGSKIGTWAETLPAAGSWTQGTDANRPTLTSGVPIFDGVSDQLVRGSEISATTFSLYIVFKDTGALSKILFAALSASDFLMHEKPSGLYDALSYKIGGATRLTYVAGLKGNRYSIFSLRRSGNTFTAQINDRTLLLKSNTFSGQATLIARMTGYVSAGFFMAAGVKAFCVSSQNLSDTINANIINSLYTQYGLGTDTAIDNVCGFGDSNTVGQGVNSYLLNLASRLGVADLNLGISGSRLTALNADSGITRWLSQIPTKPYTDYIVIQYGTNDVLGGVPSSTYATALNTLVSGLIAKGYAPSKICICSVMYLGTTTAGGQRVTELNAYRTEVENVKNTYGTKYFDLLQDFRDNGGDLNMQADGVHANATGQTRWENGVYTALTT